MTYTQIKYVVEVNETGSINKAAKNLFVSQSAISNAIQNLETEFRQKIFNRGAKGMTLTPFGKIFTSYITPIHAQIELLYSVRDNFDANLPSTTLSVASMGFHYISDVVTALYQRYRAKGIHLSVSEDYNNGALEMVMNGAAHIGVVRIWSCYRDIYMQRFSALKLLYHTVETLKVGVTVGPKNPLFNHPDDIIEPDVLADYPPIIYESINTGPYSDIFSKLDIPVNNNRFIIDSRSTLYELLGKTDGYTLNSKSIQSIERPAEGAQTHNFPYPQRFLRLKDCPVEAEVGWFCRTDYTTTQVALDFLDMLSRILRDQTYPLVIN